MIFFSAIAVWLYRVNGNYEPINWTRNILALLVIVAMPFLFKLGKPALYFGQWLLFFVVVGLMAAINSGLSK
jgi:hypothetical protein